MTTKGLSRVRAEAAKRRADDLTAERGFTPAEVAAELEARQESPARFFASKATEEEFQRCARYDAARADK